MKSMEAAINNMIDEVKKPVDPELIIERQRLEQMIKDLNTTGEIEGAKDYSGGFAERFSK
jgi:hypothetical protein